MTLSHIDADGRARMVDVSSKTITQRVAVAEGMVLMSPEAVARVRDAAVAKGDVLAVAELAGVMAAKRTADLIPLCHALPLDRVTVEGSMAEDGSGVRVVATVGATARTGVEMEALTAVSVACLTVYDMVKAIDRGMRIEGIRLLKKSGGVRGDWNAPNSSGVEENDT